MENLLRIVRIKSRNWRRVLKGVTYNDETICNAENELKRLESAYEAVFSAYQDVFISCDTAASQAYEEELDIIYAEFNGVRRRLEAAVSETPPSPASQPSTDGRSQLVTLPPITLPSFDGDVTQWQSFSELFHQLVDSNDSLTDAQRLHYLKTCTTGNAAITIQHFSATSDNYSAAWELLASKYSKKRDIIQRHLKTLRSVVTTRDADLRQVHDLVTTSLAALASMGCPLHRDAGESFLVESLLGVLPSHLQATFWRTTDQNVFPAMEELLVFIDKHANSPELQPLPALPPKTTVPAPKILNQPEPYQHPRVLQERRQPVCPACDSRHLAVNCRQFTILSTNERRDLVNRKRLCFNCMQPGHRLNQCRSSSCKECHGRHHTLLHVQQYTANQQQRTCNSVQRYQPTSSVQQQPVYSVQRYQPFHFTQRQPVNRTQQYQSNYFTKQQPARNQQHYQPIHSDQQQPDDSLLQYHPVDSAEQQPTSSTQQQPIDHYQQ
jgi:hypothetical protein